MSMLVNGWTLCLRRSSKMVSPYLEHPPPSKLLLQKNPFISAALTTCNNCHAESDCETNLTSTAFNGMDAQVPVGLKSRRYSLPFRSIINQVNDGHRIQLQFRLVQSDHRGGFCDCWAVAKLIIINFNESSEVHMPLE